MVISRKIVYGTTGYVDRGGKMVCILKRAIYGLKQSPDTWYDKIQLGDDVWRVFVTANHRLFGPVVLLIFYCK